MSAIISCLVNFALMSDTVNLIVATIDATIDLKAEIGIWIARSLVTYDPTSEAIEIKIITSDASQRLTNVFTTFDLKSVYTEPKLDTRNNQRR
jgi:hypothetical protein